MNSSMGTLYCVSENECKSDTINFQIQYTTYVQKKFSHHIKLQNTTDWLIPSICISTMETPFPTDTSQHLNLLLCFECCWLCLECGKATKVEIENSEVEQKLQATQVTRQRINTFYSIDR